jgi:hypothetical protein
MVAELGLDRADDLALLGSENLTRGSFSRSRAKAT